MQPPRHLGDLPTNTIATAHNSLATTHTIAWNHGHYWRWNISGKGYCLHTHTNQEIFLENHLNVFLEHSHSCFTTAFDCVSLTQLVFHLSRTHMILHRTAAGTDHINIFNHLMSDQTYIIPSQPIIQSSPIAIVTYKHSMCNIWCISPSLSFSWTDATVWSDVVFSKQACLKKQEIFNLCAIRMTCNCKMTFMFDGMFQSDGAAIKRSLSRR